VSGISEQPASEIGPRPTFAQIVRRWIRPVLAIPTPIIFVAAAVIAGLLLWRQGSLGDVGESLRDVSPLQTASVLITYAASILVLGVRWHVLTRMAGGAPTWTSSAEVFMTSVIVNYAAPIGLAVPTRAALTVRDLGLSPVQSGTVVGWELALDIIALMAISTLWLGLGGMALLRSISVDFGFVVVGAILLALAAGGVFLLSRVTAIRSRLISILRPMYQDPLRQPASALLAVALTALFWSLQTGVMAALLGAFGIAPTLSLVAGLMGLPVLIGMLSPIPGGAGVREALMAAMARLEGSPAAPVILAAVTYRMALFIVTPIVWGALRLARARLKGR